VLLIAAQLGLGLLACLLGFLELALTFLVFIGPGGYTGEDDDRATWHAFLPWTIGLWLVVIALIIYHVGRALKA
jgi:hypothetical protein